MPTRTVHLDLGPDPYDVIVGHGVLTDLGSTVRNRTRAASVLLVHDAALPDALTRTAEQSLQSASIRTAHHGVAASERNKSLHTAQAIVEAAAAARLERTDAIVALGGGVVGDLAGFAASIYRRGIAIVHCPTTLLAMVDAAIGGKTAVNLLTFDARLLKNMAGTFHQPRAVLADTAALASLPPRHLRAGLAECVKHAMLSADVGDDTLLAAMEREGPDVAAGAASTAALVDLIARNIAVKARVVERDTTESAGIHNRPNSNHDAGREALNLGHTFGHALEAMQHLSPDADPASAPLLHGEAVALGLVAAAATAEALGQLPPDSTARVRRLLDAIALPTRIAALPDDNTILAAMMDDKKVMGGRLRLVLPWRELGRVRVAEDPSREAVAAGLAAIRAD